MKVSGLKNAFRILGLVLLPFSGLFIVFALAAWHTKAADPAIPFLLFGLFLFFVAAYFLWGAPHLLRAIKRMVMRK
jgi:uncharacterized membrane protein YfcA